MALLPLQNSYRLSSKGSPCWLPMIGFVGPPLCSSSTLYFPVVALCMSTIPSLFTCLSPIRFCKILEAGAKACHSLNLESTWEVPVKACWLLNNAQMIVNPGLRSDKDVGRHGWEMTSVHTVLIRKKPSIKIPSGSTRPSSYNHTSVLDIFGYNLKFPPHPWLCCFLFHCLFLLHGLKHYSWYSYQKIHFFFFGST